MSEKYAPFIDIYADVPEQERNEILQDLAEKEEVQRWIEQRESDSSS